MTAGECDHDFGGVDRVSDEFIGMANRLQTELDTWIKAGGLKDQTWKCPQCGKCNCDGYCTVDRWEPGIGFDR